MLYDDTTEKEHLLSSRGTSFPPSSPNDSSAANFDVVIIGAGISGVNAAYRIQSQLPNLSYTILDSRYALGGTWDFFRYPGIRSDSDLYTFGFPWRPWEGQEQIVDGESIYKYICNTAAEFGIDKHVRFGHAVKEADWSTESQSWRLNVDITPQGEEKTTQRIFNTKFLFVATGYYDYTEALPATIPGIENFKGTVIHPQFWPKDLDYTDKTIVIIGSGATAITLLPSLVDKAKHVTMLQRSPSYIAAVPLEKNRESSILYKLLPLWLYLSIQRWKAILLTMLLFEFCRAFPNAARGVFKKATIKLLPENIPHDPHFNPSYNPWEQRMCASPDGDFFTALASGKGSVSTGAIRTITSDSIVLNNDKDETLPADILITATGLKMRLAGGIVARVDGREIKYNEKFLWKGVLMQDMPNTAIAIGYTNASWTLGADATAQHVCRLLKTMRKQGYTSVTPRVDPQAVLKEVPLVNLKSNYIEKAKGTLPKAADKGVWRGRTRYVNDLWEAKFGDLKEGLEFQKVST